MMSKMQDHITLYDFDLLNAVIENNYKIKHTSTVLIPKI
jgi:hypothetical protein